MFTIYYCGERVGHIVRSGNGDAFPWSQGTVQPTPMLQDLLRFVRWAQWQLDNIHHPPEQGPDSLERFKATDNQAVIDAIDRFLRFAASTGQEQVSIEALGQVDGLADFADWWDSPYYRFKETALTCEDMHRYQIFLRHESWRIVDGDDRIVPGFSNPILFNTTDFSIGWR